MIELADQDRFLTTSEAAEYLRRSKRTLARMRAEGGGPPFHRHGSKVLYSLTALRDWMTDQTVVPAGVSS